MPSSIPNHIASVVASARSVVPNTILDLGVGYGKWGLLFREYLESWDDKVYPTDWDIDLTGVEIHKPYVDEFTWLHQIYTRVICMDALEFLKASDRNFDLIMAGDVLEHLPADKAESAIRRCCIMSNRLFILSIPIGEAWMGNKVIGNNPHEAHKSWWTMPKLERIFRDYTNNITKQTFMGGRGTVVTYCVYNRRQNAEAK